MVNSSSFSTITSLQREHYYIHMWVYYHHLEAVAVKRAYFGSFEFHPIHLDNVQCTGSEENITQCNYVTSTAINCDHSEDAGVICGGENMRILVMYVYT